MDKSKMMMFVIIALLVILLGTVVGVGIYLIGMGDDNGGFDTPNLPVTQDGILPGDLRLVSLDSMTANLALGPNNRSDNIIVDVVLGLNAGATVDEDELERFYGELNRSLAVARSIAMDVFLSRTYEEVRTLEGRQETAEVMKFRLQEAFNSNLIVQVFFNEWNAVRGR